MDYDFVSLGTGLFQVTVDCVLTVSVSMSTPVPDYPNDGRLCPYRISIYVFTCSRLYDFVSLPYQYICLRLFQTMTLCPYRINIYVHTCSRLYDFVSLPYQYLCLHLFQTIQMTVDCVLSVSISTPVPDYDFVSLLYQYLYLRLFQTMTLCPYRISIYVCTCSRL